MQNHSHEVSSGRQAAAVGDLGSVSGWMNQCAVLLNGYLDSKQKQTLEKLQNPSSL